MNNLRTVKKQDVANLVQSIFNDYKVDTMVNFAVNSLYCYFRFSLPSNDISLCNRLQSAFHELYIRRIISEKPMEDFKDYANDCTIHERFIHPFNIVE